MNEIVQGFGVCQTQKKYKSQIFQLTIHSTEESRAIAYNMGIGTGGLKASKLVL